MMKKILIPLVLVLSACAPKIVEKPVEVIKYRTAQVERPQRILPRPDPVKMRDVNWKIINQEEITYFALDKYSYEALSLNLNDLRTYIQQTNRIMESR